MYYVTSLSSVVSSVTFAPFAGAKIVTDQMPEGYRDCGNIIVIS